jgi:hypothetical protein
MTLSGLFTSNTAKEIVSAMSNGEVDGKSIQEQINPLSLKELCSSFAVKRDNPLNLEGIVEYSDRTVDQVKSDFAKAKRVEGMGVAFKFPIYIPSGIDITAGDLDLGGIGYIDNIYIDKEGNHYLSSKKDVCTYLYNFMNNSLDNYVANVWKK